MFTRLFGSTALDYVLPFTDLEQDQGGHLLGGSLTAEVGNGSPVHVGGVETVAGSEYSVHLVQDDLMAHSKVLSAPKLTARRAAKDRRIRLNARLRGDSAGKQTVASGQVERVQIRLGSIIVHARTLGIAAGRNALPKMVQESVNLEDAFLLRNVKNPTAPEVLVINPAALDQELRRVRPSRTLGDVIDVLPFGRKGVPSLRLHAPPDGETIQRLRLPVRTQGGRQEAAATPTADERKGQER